MDHILVVRSLVTVYDILGRLTSLESGWDLSMLLLTLVTSSRRLSLSTGWTTSATNALLVGLVSVVQASKNRGVADGEEGNEKGGNGAISDCCWAKRRGEGRYPGRHYCGGCAAFDLAVVARLIVGILGFWIRHVLIRCQGWLAAAQHHPMRDGSADLGRNDLGSGCVNIVILVREKRSLNNIKSALQL